MKLRILSAFLMFSLLSNAQVAEQDCIKAIDVCQSTYSYGTFGIEGSGSIPNEINTTNSCLFAGDENAVWFRVYTTQPGILKFTIKPYDTTADYNWAVFNLTQANCSHIFSDPTLEVSCNSSANITNNGYTGPNGGSNPQEEQGIFVGDGEWYYIAISSPSIISTGFIIDFTGSTSLGGNNPLEFVNQSPPNLVPANQLYVYLNQPARCFSMTVSDFRVYDSNNQDIPIVSLDNPFCSNPSDLVSSCILYLSADLVEGMQYKLTKVGNIQTRCTYIDTGYAELVFIAPPAADSIISYENRPEQDCITAMPVCSANMSVNGSYTGQGLIINELNNNEACLGSGEFNSVWFRIPIQSNGNLNFTIRPTDYDADFDWAVYNLTNAACSDIFTDVTLETACNFSGSTFPLGITGANGGYNAPEEPVIPVLAGEVYYLLVSNYSNNIVSGFTLDMTNSTCGIEYQFDETFSDAFTPQYFPPYNLQVLFSNYILCNSVQASDFALYNTQTGFQYTITNVEPYLCDGPGDSTANKVQLTFFPQLAPNNSYTVVRTGQVQNLCGQQSVSSDSIVFTAVITGLDEVAPAFTVNTLAIDKAVITSSLPLSGIFSIYNLSGMLMQSTRVENINNAQLDMVGYADGLYILTFTNTNGQSYSAKIVKTGY